MDEQTALLKTQLYAACEDACNLEPDRLFTQEDLMGLEVVPPKDLKKLVQIISQLTAERLFAPVHLHSGVAWRLRPQAEAAKYKLLTNQDQLMVYEIIDNAGAEGAWQQDIKRRLNLQDNALRKALKELETKRLIVQFSTVENVSKKMWIKTNIKPSARATGGPWYTDQYLDEAYIDALQSLILGILKREGAHESERMKAAAAAKRNKEKKGKAAGSQSPVQPKKGFLHGADSAAAAKSRKRTADAISKDDPPKSNTTSTTARPGPGQGQAEDKTVKVGFVPKPAGFTGYPTVEHLTEEVQPYTRGQALTVEHVRELLQVLTWDGLVEEVKVGARVGYRVTRVGRHTVDLTIRIDAPGHHEPRQNGLTAVPCGRCPVFELCEEGGPVWAGGCEYFDQWLARDGKSDGDDEGENRKG
ncbi:RNA polymerase Rpc34 subunit [Xylariomycetidae sp. FL0641]|nr:RNA polymerase Rpc34 subunit [Xylariomycetidae sp. FL0641]